MDYAQYKQIEFRRKFWKIVGAEIVATVAGTDQEIGFIKMKAWKLKEDVRLYTDRTAQQEIIGIHARSVIDFGATYDVSDSASTQPLFSFRRKGLKSTFVRDHWDIQDQAGNITGQLQETSSGLALARRWLELLPFGEIIGLIFAFIPQTYTISLKDQTGALSTVATVIHRKNPFIVKMLLDTSMATVPVNPLMPIAATSLLSVIDATKNN